MKMGHALKKTDFPETCAANDFEYYWENSPYRIVVGNNPVNWVDPSGLAGIYGQGGGQVSGHVGIAGLSVSGGFATSTGGQTCSYVTTCLRVGPGIYAGGGMTAGVGGVSGNTSNLGGLSIGLGGDLGWGPSVGGQVSGGTTSAGVSKGVLGGGGGFSFGIDFCWTELKCTNNTCNQ